MACVPTDYGQSQPLVGDGLLKNGMCADQYVDRTVGQAHQRGFADAPFVTTGENSEIDRHAGKQPRQILVMLPRKNLRGCKQGALGARFHRDQQRHQRDQRLARTHIALEQPQHRGRLGQVAFDFGDGPTLCSRELVRQFERCPQPPVALQRRTTSCA